MKEIIERCDLCGRSDNEVRLFDTLSIGAAMRICEKCSLIENIPILKWPSTNQLKESEKPFGVRERLMRLAGFKQKEKKETVAEGLRNLKEHPELEKPSEASLKLVDNFHWKLMTERRRRGFTIKQLASRINESESAIVMLEKGNVPSNAFTLIKKLEQFFKFELIKKNFIDIIREEELKKLRRERFEFKTRTPEIIKVEEPTKITEEKIREKIKEEERKIKNEGAEDMLSEVILTEKDPRIRELEPISFKPKVLDFDKARKNNMTIAQLNRVSRLIEQDFPKKSKEEVGKEQFNGFGKEDEKELRKAVMREYEKKPELKQIQRGEVPSIYDLMKKKEEKDKESLIGKDIQIID